MGMRTLLLGLFPLFIVSASFLCITKVQSVLQCRRDVERKGHSSFIVYTSLS